MATAIVMIGKKFGRWTVIETVPHIPDRTARYLCRCECGTERSVDGSVLRRGKSVSCGCYARECARDVCIKRCTKHGYARTPFYGQYSNMLNRCENPKTPDFKDYGAKGITVCSEWHDFRAFLADMGEPEPGMSLLRIDTSGNYEKSNCRWGDISEQSCNKKNSILLSYQGKILPMVKWAEITGIKYQTIHNRLELGWIIETALSTAARYISPPHSKVKKPNVKKLVRADADTSYECRTRKVIPSRFRLGPSHGQSGRNPTRLYYCWSSMKKRCENPKCNQFTNYGGRGIKVCAEWHDFARFAADMGEPLKGESIDRIDPNGDYEPSNCRWATVTQQNRNKRQLFHVMMTYQGKTQCLTAWCEELGFRKHTIQHRRKKGWNDEKCLSTPLRSNASRRSKLLYLRAKINRINS